MNAEKTDQGRSCKPFKFDLALSVLSAFICVLLLCAVCPAQVHPHSFSPRQLGIMQAWYRADAVTALADGDPVASWVDSTANARTLAQSTADYRPAYKVSIQNGRPAIRFDGTNDTLTGAFGGSLQFTVFSVQRPDIFTPYETIYMALAIGYNVWALYPTAAPQTRLSFGFDVLEGSSYYYPWHASSTTVPELWTVRYDQSWWRSWVNGGALDAQAETRPPYTGTVLAVGAWWQGFRHLDGDIFELAFFAEALSDRDRQRVERYLARKWGL
jgi:hypothetical protein